MDFDGSTNCELGETLERLGKTEDLQAEQLEIEVMGKSVCWKELEQKDNLALVIWQKPANHVHRDQKGAIRRAQDPVMAW